MPYPPADPPLPADPQPGVEPRWELLGTLLIAAAVVAHVVFVLLDGRLPTDVGGQYREVPRLVELLGGPRWPEALAHAATRSTGWYELVTAAAVRILGPAATELRALDAGWLLLLSACAGAVARRLGGSAARAAAVGLIAANPMIVQQARLGSIHVAEAALGFAPLALLLADPELAKRRGLIAVAAAGALVAALRPSGLVWLAPLAVVIVAQAPRRRAILALLAWGIGAVPSLVGLGRYVSTKVERREVYDAVVPGLISEVWYGWGAGFCLLAAAGAAIWAARRAPAGSRAGLLVLGSWLVAGVALKLVFHSGLIDFVPTIVAVAVLAGRGLALWRPAALGPVAVMALVLLPAYQRGGVLDADRRFDTLGASEITTLLDTLPRGRGRLAVDQGLFRPYAEDERLELAVLGRGRLDVVALRSVRGDVGALRVDALVEIVCDPELDLAWRRRWPGSRAVADRVKAVNGLAPAWTRDVGSGCTWSWWTPGGRLVPRDR